MNKIVALAVALALFISALVGCAGTQDVEIGYSQITTTVETSTTTTTTEARKTISVGETIKTANYEIHIKDVQITSEILPPDTSGQHNMYEAEDDEILVYVDADVKNLKTSFASRDGIYSATLFYSTGFAYKGQIIVLSDNAHFSYPALHRITPLKKAFVGCMFVCPFELKDSGEPITIEFKVDGETYCLKYR